jgi:outer membrane protein OmpA-like peptidoglycan-associated protein
MRRRSHSNRGNNDANQQVSVSRAEAVLHFAQQDISGRRMQVQGFGEDYPRFDNRTQDGRADNDRVEIIFEMD